MYSNRRMPLTWRIGEGRTASGCQLRSNLESIPGVGPQTVITWLAEIGDITPVRLREQAAGVLRAGSVGSDLGREGDGDEGRARGMPGCTARCGTRRERCSAVPRRASSRCGHADTWGVTPEAGKSKAVHALARRIGKALYYCHLKNEPFDDSGYQALLSESSYPLCPVEEMGLSAGVVRNLKGNGLQTSRQVVDAFYSDLGRRPGCGKVTVQAVATWINSHRNRSQERPPQSPGNRGVGKPGSTEG